MYLTIIDWTNGDIINVAGYTDEVTNEKLIEQFDLKDHEFNWLWREEPPLMKQYYVRDGKIIEIAPFAYGITESPKEEA